MHLKDLLTEEQNSLRETMRKFVDREIMPVRSRLEEDHELVEAVLQKLVDLGMQKAGYPTAYGGGGGGDMITKALLTEQLARGDGGIALVAGINAGTLLKPAMVAQNQVVLDRFVPAFCGDRLNYACLSMTDTLGGADTENPLLRGRGISTRARLEGDEYVITGSKSWPTSAGKASVYLTVCTTDPALGDEGIALLYVPGDARGLSVGKPERKLGFRSSVNASVSYDDVRVPKTYRAAGPGMDAKLYYALMTGAQWHSSVISLGMAQEAFDIAVSYAGERKSHGRPVREWSLAAGVIAEMAIRLETTRATVYDLARMLDQPQSYGPPFSPQMSSRAAIARHHAAESCLFIVNKAIELLGSNGLSPDYHLEKYYRDAKVTQLWLGGQQVALYRIAQGYYDYAARG